jgi:hypothetical protein
LSPLRETQFIVRTNASLVGDYVFIEVIIIVSFES